MLNIGEFMLNIDEFMLDIGEIMLNIGEIMLDIGDFMLNIGEFMPNIGIISFCGNCTKIKNPTAGIAILVVGLSFYEYTID